MLVRFFKAERVIAWVEFNASRGSLVRFVNMCACVHACVRACVRAYVRTCVRACVRVCVCVCVSLQLKK